LYKELLKNASSNIKGFRYTPENIVQIDKAAQAYAVNHAAELITDIDENTRGMIAADIEDALASGDSWQSLAKTLLDNPRVSA
jgi:hypothetical protein